MEGSSMRRLVLSLAVAVMLLLAACGIGDIANPAPDRGIPLTPADVVGTWRNEKLDGTITFAGDGTFKATNLPYEMFVGNESIPPSFDPATDRVDAVGTWHLSEVATDRHVIVEADFSPGPPFEHGSGERLESEKQPDGAGALLLLVPYAPRFGGRYLYRKVVAGTPVPSSS